MKSIYAAVIAALVVSHGAFAQVREDVSPGPEGNVPPSTPDAIFVPSGSVLYDNGPLVNSPGTGVGGADESVLQTTSLGMNTLGAGHQVLNGNRVADDFVVPAGGWVVNRFDFFAYQTNSPTTSTMTAVNFRIWDGVPGAVGSNVVFGDTTTNRLTTTAFSNIFRVTETTTGAANNRPIMVNTADGLGLNLAAGTYWVDWQTDGSLASGPWAPPITINGQAVTGNALQSLDSGVTYAPLLDTGTNTPAQGLPFIISGTVANADVSVSLSSNAPMGAIDVGTQFDYTVVGSNAGPGVANDLMFTLTLSSKVSFVSSSCGAVAAGNSVTWTVATLGVGATTSCAVTVAVVAPGDLLASVNVTTSTDDPNLANNVAELVVGFVATQVPTLGSLALLLLVLMIAGATVVVIRR